MKKTFRRRRRASTKRRRRSTKKRGSAQYDTETRCYGRTWDVRLDADTDDFSRVISLFSAKCAASVEDTITIEDMSQNDVLLNNMQEYSQFSITGVSFKYIPTGVTQYDVRPSCITVATCPDQIMHSYITDERLHALATYQIMPIDPTRPISRYYSTAVFKRRAGVSYCDTKEYIDQFFNQPYPTYDEQIGVDKGASVHIRVKRPLVDGGRKPFADFGKLHVKYYVRFRGVKGKGNLSKP